MENNKTIFNYFSQVFATFGIIVFIFTILGILVGEGASVYSSLFDLGNKGFSISTLVQLLFFSVIISVAQIFFLTDRLIKNMSLILRNACFFGVVVIAVVFFVTVFHWFPLTNVKSWIGFSASFIVCTAISIIISRIKEQAENKKMAQALDKLQKKPN